jgi:hypothetical protein
LSVALKIAAIFLLLLNSIGAMYGGYNFITDPSGSSMQLPLSFLEHSPFSSYLIPGIVLITINGIFGFTVIILLLINHRAGKYFVVAQGGLLGGWILVQMMMLRTFYPPLHLSFLLIGAALVFLGFAMKSKH